MIFFSLLKSKLKVAWLIPGLCILFAITDKLSADVQQTRIQFLFTSDLHGWLSTSLIFPDKTKTGLLHISQAIQKRKSNNPEAILIDGGDLLQGSPLAHFVHRTGEMGYKKDLFFKLIRSLKYDAVVVGNHDLAINPLFENTYLPKANFYWLGANISRYPRHLVHPYIILHRGGLKIAIIGLTTPGAQMWLYPNRLDGIWIEPVKASLSEWLRYIKRNESPDLVVGAFHVGLNPFRDDVNSKLHRLPPANGVKAAIKAVKGLDLAFLGHDHTLNPKRTGADLIYIENTPVISGGRWGEALISVNLLLRKGEKEVWRITSIENEVIRASQANSIKDTYIRTLSDEYKKYIYKRLPYRFMKTSRLDAEKCLNLLQAMANDTPTVDGVFLPKIRIKKISRYVGHTVRRRDLFHWIPYDNRSVTLSLSNREILLIDQSNKHILANGTVIIKSIFPFLKKNRIKLDNKSDWWLNANDFDNKHSIVVSDYHYSGGGGVLSPFFIHRKQPVRYSSEFTRDRLFNFLTEHQSPLPEICRFLRPIKTIEKAVVYNEQNAPH